MRLIDADALIKDAFDLMDRNELLEDVPQIIKDYCDAQPTVDAVPVIRCYECKHFRTDLSDPDESPWCYDGIIDPSFHEYCSRAERKEK